jgi:jumonji domain-containing protein 2
MEIQSPSESNPPAGLVAVPDSLDDSKSMSVGVFLPSPSVTVSLPGPSRKPQDLDVQAQAEPRDAGPPASDGLSMISDHVVGSSLSGLRNLHDDSSATDKTGVSKPLREEIVPNAPADECEPTLPWKQCNVHRPSISELQGQSFSNYIRNTVLRGSSPMYVHLDGDDQDAAAVGDDNSEEMCDYHHGMAKVVLPTGFLSKKGIAGDETARGPEWQAGRMLGDRVIGSPIRQYVRGLAGTYSYTLMDETQKTVAEFREIADAYQKDLLAPLLKKSSKGGKEKSDKNADARVSAESCKAPSITALERCFWKRLGPTMPPPMYGADQEGTLFHDDDGKTGWSLGHLDSCLHVLGHVPGVTSPYLYFGMFASVFCVHTEDMNLLSINYLHAGAPKIWYGIASAHAARFQALASGCFCTENCSEFLRHKQSLISPQVLKKAGIPFTFMVQYPGEAMVTFPGAYHFGFNAGFNVAEATNFGVPEWIPFGKRAKVCLCRPDSVRIDMEQFCRLLDLYQASQKSRRRGARLSWKAWGEKRRKEQDANDSFSDSDDHDDDSLGDESVKRENSTKAKSKGKSGLSEQQRRNEFWVEVMKPVTKSTNSSKSRKVGMKSIKKRPLRQKQDGEVWHLAQPCNRKRLVPETRVLVILPAKETGKRTHRGTRRGDDSDSDSLDDEQCFAGRVVEISDNHARVHFDGLTKSDDAWVPLQSPKLFLDGGRWSDEKAGGMPELHYWQEMDSKRRCAAK